MINKAKCPKCKTEHSSGVAAVANYHAKCHKCDFIADSQVSQELADRYLVNHFLEKHVSK